MLQRKYSKELMHTCKYTNSDILSEMSTYSDLRPTQVILEQYSARSVNLKAK